jgi:hypothetical protein
MIPEDVGLLLLLHPPPLESCVHTVGSRSLSSPTADINREDVKFHEAPVIMPSIEQKLEDATLQVDTKRSDATPSATAVTIPATATQRAAVGTTEPTESTDDGHTAQTFVMSIFFVVMWYSSTVSLPLSST